MTKHAPPARKLNADGSVEMTVKIYLSPDDMELFDEMCQAEYRQRSNMVGFLVTKAINEFRNTTTKEVTT